MGSGRVAQDSKGGGVVEVVPVLMMLSDRYKSRGK